MKTSVVQFGTSRFLQAHVDLFLQEAAAAGEPERLVTVVASSGSGSARSRLEGFNRGDGYPVIIRGLEDGVRVEREHRVTCVRRGLDAAADWRELLRVVTEEAQFIVSNTTESGFAVPAGLTVNLAAPEQAAPPSYPAKLLALLAARFATGARPLTILPTELLRRNGDALRAIVLDLAERSGASEGLTRWIGRDCIFANSLVDRIVSAPLDPVGAIAEPYGLWAVESQAGLIMPCRHPAIRIVDDLEPYARLKLHILNLGHSVLAERWSVNGPGPSTTVREMLAEPETRASLLSLYEDEVLPGFSAHGLADQAASYVQTTLARFDNPYLDHRLSDIAGGHVDKVDKRIAGFIEWAGSGLSLPRLAAIAARHLPGRG